MECTLIALNIKLQISLKRYRAPNVSLIIKLTEYVRIGYSIDWFTVNMEFMLPLLVNKSKYSLGNTIIHCTYSTFRLNSAKHLRYGH